jgi:hypothetical protein
MMQIDYVQRIKDLIKKYDHVMKIYKLVQDIRDDSEEYKRLQISRVVGNTCNLMTVLNRCHDQILERIRFSVARAIKWPIQKNTYMDRKYISVVGDKRVGLHFNGVTGNVEVSVFDPSESDVTEFTPEDIYTIPQALRDKYGEEYDVTNFLKKKGVLNK